MTSPTLNAMLQSAVASAYPELEMSGLDKVELLRAVMDAHGWAAVVALGRRVGDLEWHPVVRALTASSDPAAVIGRWIRLEHFGHSRNRTELVARDVVGDMITLELRHLALDGGHIVAVNDLFIWVS